MEEKQLRLSPRPFWLTVAALFVAGLACITLLLGNAPLFRGEAPAMAAVCLLVVAVAAVAGAFVICGVAETLRGFRSGQLQGRDLVFPVVLLVALIALFVGEAWLPKVARGVELGLLLLWAVLELRRGRRSAKNAGGARLASACPPAKPEACPRTGGTASPK